jgi:hypothetical protein
MDLSMAALQRFVVQYYTALSLSAGAAALDWALDIQPQRERPPIVRRFTSIGPAGFDRREVVELRGRVCVVTLPAARQGSEQYRLCLN